MTRLALGGLALGIATGALAPDAHSAKEDRVFTVGNYPIEARAADAVAAKERAISEGQQAAFRSLLKRLVPVTAFKRLDKLKTTPVGNLVESFAVRSERNSSTDYIASYDFVFSPEPVRRLLEQEGIPYLDRQAPPIVIVPAYRLPSEGGGKLPQTYSPAAGSDAWLYAWKALDLGNSLTPVSLQALKSEVHADTVNALAEGNLGMMRTLAAAYNTESIVLAVLEPESDLKRIKVVLVGRDAVQDLYLKRTYRLDGHDLAYTAESAAVVSLAILEGRWKAVSVRGDRTAAVTAQPAYPRAPVASDRSPPGSAAPTMTIAVEFNGMGEWQAISRELARTPDVSGLDVLGMSARGARVSLNYPGSQQELALALASQGLILQNTGTGLLLSRR